MVDKGSENLINLTKTQIDLCFWMFTNDWIFVNEQCPLMELLFRLLLSIMWKIISGNCCCFSSVCLLALFKRSDIDYFKSKNMLNRK